ncbi:hypothetical protein [Sagittula sp. S175]|uniref:hypothetical protein n=1 Tax=Sagittula sp. S175 TaxID=3415129 RepID=UPI003C7E287A
MSAGSDLKHLLDPSERVLWTGHPDVRITRQDVSLPRILIGILVTGFALFWIRMALFLTEGIREAPVQLFPLFGLIFVAIGLYNMGLHVFWDSFRRSRTVYVLTDRRAFIITSLPLQSRRLKDHSIGELTREQHGEGLGSVWFAERVSRHKRTTTRTPVGFERIPDAPEVHRMMQQARQDRS